MNSLQEAQITALNHRIDRLSETIERLSLQISGLLTQRETDTRSDSEPSGFGNYGNRPHASEMSLLGSLMEHKDVLLDGNSMDLSNQNGEKQLSPEIQIQRLTAQLTAAYNRIAALEEQLLSRRVH
ncbi:hypothetical protein IQ235_05395 [Oscillatoriales cyanobacterium LEGE 11467]|uniref:Uncharacterized protein n=1 Tax=Zarconia navalis LEGE 11467 TaxID=1828826 RepID=A0A928Z8W1_9CYAN|nr:hypothetical protein [Zarconia navalis LEGE 11467]